MKLKKGHTLAIILASVVTILLLTSIVILCTTANASEPYFEGEAKVYYDNLIASGFPPAYATELTELHLLHPTWSFVPLLVTETNKAYTWDYVIGKETENPETNLISPSDSYRLYRHPTNTEQYDSGYYQASSATVRYFMDPRNFLNETDIFQFYDLSSSETASESAVRAVLAGTFMESGRVETGESYAACLMRIGNELGISPVYLAAKLRQEQGIQGSSPLLSGQCGTLLADYYANGTQKLPDGTQVLAPSEGYTEKELLAYNGYYNLYNVGAGGNGLFAIYLGGMKAAVKGTPELSAKWGGNPSWNTREKAIYGGAYVIKTRYIDRYQSTVYLQKFNVDGRAADRNFWWQYMQSISGALTEGRSLYQSFASMDALDAPATFLIPVYNEMPDRVSADPAAGTCAYLAPATGRYTFGVSMQKPVWVRRTKNAPIYASYEVDSGKTFSLSLDAEHSYGITALEYSIDGGPWTAIVGDALELTLSADYSPNSVHIVVVRGRAAYDASASDRKSCYTFPAAVLYLQIPEETATVTLNIGSVTESTTYSLGSEVTLPDCSLEHFVGWLGSDGRFLPDQATFTATEDLSFTAIPLSLTALDGAALSFGEGAPSLCFYALTSETEAQQIPDGVFTYFATLKNKSGTRTVPLEPTRSQRADRQLLTAALPLTDASAYTLDTSSRFRVRIAYSDGTFLQVEATGAPFTRNARYVAHCALADKETAYPADLLERLRLILQTGKDIP